MQKKMDGTNGADKQAGKSVGGGARSHISTLPLEIIRGKLLAIADEMGVLLARSSMSPVIYEVLDYAVGLCDTDAQLISQANGITIFTGTFAPQIESIRKKFAGDIHPGDIFLSNDPYEGGTHLNDVAVIKPVFVEGRIIAFTIAISHWSDIGGKAPGSLPTDSTEIFQEGIRFPGVRIYHEGRRQNDIADIISANVRLPKMCLGDLNASLAAVRTADARVQELCDQYGPARVRAAFEHILESSERMSRTAIAALPDGTYEAEDWIDGDGISDKRFRVHVTVRITGDEIVFDYSGCCGQLTGPLNCSSGALHSAVKTIVKALVDPEAPSNEGWFRPIRVIAPEGIVFNATPPAPMGWYYEVTGHASELAWKALAPLAPERFSAGSCNTICAAIIGGTDHRTGEPFVLPEPGMVGWGATDKRRGASVVSAITNGDTFNYSLELLEAKFPIRVHQYALNIHGGVGAGRHPGGYGFVREYELLTDQAVLSASFGRSIQRAWGLRGGGQGSCSYLEIERDGQSRRAARLPTTLLERGDHVRYVTGGGAGYGDPFTRPASEVLQDVASDYLTPQQAIHEYGVVIRADGTLDEAKTDKARAARR